MANVNFTDSELAFIYSTLPDDKLGKSKSIRKKIDHDSEVKTKHHKSLHRKGSHIWYD
jgi:hypothetical protein